MPKGAADYCKAVRKENISFGVMLCSQWGYGAVNRMLFFFYERFSNFCNEIVRANIKNSAVEPHTPIIVC